MDSGFRRQPGPEPWLSTAATCCMNHSVGTQYRSRPFASPREGSWHPHAISQLHPPDRTTGDRLGPGVRVQGSTSSGSASPGAMHGGTGGQGRRRRVLSEGKGLSQLDRCLLIGSMKRRASSVWPPPMWWELELPAPISLGLPSLRETDNITLYAVGELGLRVAG